MDTRTAAYAITTFLVSITLPIIFTYLILKSKRTIKFKLLLYKIFWIDKFQGVTFTHKFLSFGSRFFMIFYLFSVPMMLISNIFDRDWEGLIFAVIVVIIYPLMYRIIMGFQRIIHHL